MEFLGLVVFLVLIFGLVMFLNAGTVSMTIQKQVSGIVSATSLVAVQDDNGIIANPTVLVAQPAVLTTHTTNTTGSITMTNSSHGIITGQRIDIYWTGGQCFGAVVGTVSGTTVPVASVSGGSNLPASSTPITVGIPYQTPFSFTGNNLKGLVESCPTANGYFVMNDGSADQLPEYLVAGQVYTYDGIGTNPLAGIVPTTIWMSHSDITSAHADMVAAAVTH